MQLPFTREAFLNVFKAYNTAIWPLQFLFYAMAISVIYLMLRRSRWSDAIIAVIGASLWVWMGVVYHIIFFSVINKAAYLFGFMFIAEAALLLYFGVFRGTLSFHFNKNKYGITGMVLIIFALFIYPLVGYAVGRNYPYNPGFGLPCPTTIFTLGLLLCTETNQPWPVLLIPVLWSMIGFTAAFKLGIYEDIGLMLSGLTALLVFITKPKRLND
jgi:hypothetical protein